MSQIRVLIVDDEEDFLELVRERLEFGGYLVDTATDGKKALIMIAQQKPDIILLDLMMPHMNGYEVCERLKNDEMYMDIPIIILTAKAQEEDKRRGLRAGADDYLVKPFEPKELISKIEEFTKDRRWNEKG